MGLYFEVGNKSCQHFRVLPIHLHVVYLSIDSKRAQQRIERSVLKKKGVSAYTTIKNDGTLATRDG
jgi:hypothetical protein